MRKQFLPKASLQTLYDVLQAHGYKVVGPQVEDSAIVFKEQKQSQSLPWGWQEETSPGTYSLQHKSAKSKSKQQSAFAWNTGPQGIKPWLFKPEQEIWRAVETEDGLRFRQSEQHIEPIAFIGLRACDLAALNIQDKHFVQGAYADPFYTGQRQQLLLIAVNCQRSTETCFCVSTGDGPEVRYGYDILLDELDEGYLIDAKSAQGEQIIDELGISDAEHLQLQQQSQIQKASKQQRKMPSATALQALINKLDDKRWQQIAERCLACGNCTSVCPTCFCSKQESQSYLIEKDPLQENPESNDKNPVSSQVRLWDSCFSEKHSYIHGKTIRTEISQQYRQWLIHKLLTWQSQYGRTGCVGCGRCISWCPVGIDLVEEASALLAEGTL